MALVWGCVTPVSTSRGDQPLVLGGPITGAAHEVVWADGGRCRGHGKLITRKRLQSSHGGVSQVSVDVYIVPKYVLVCTVACGAICSACCELGED